MHLERRAASKVQDTGTEADALPDALLRTYARLFSAHDQIWMVLGHIEKISRTSLHETLL